MMTVAEYLWYLLEQFPWSHHSIATLRCVYQHQNWFPASTYEPDCLGSSRNVSEDDTRYVFRARLSKGLPTLRES
jgi:hypothetical protein